MQAGTVHAVVEGMTMLERIQAHLADGGVVVVSSMTRHTVFAAKHASYFEAPTRPEETGIYFRTGKQRLYAFEYQIRFARYKAA